MFRSIAAICLMLSFTNQCLAQEQNPANLPHTAAAQVTTFSLPAPQLHTSKKIWLYLPKEYATAKKKYPVLYMHDAQNLFDAATSYAGEWKIDEKLDSLRAEVIVVGIEHGNEKRLDELTPFSNAKYGGGHADAYLDFIVQTLKPEIDRNYRTKSDAKHTLMMGSSLGGLTSFYASLKYPKIFGKVGVFSPSFWINRNEILNLTRQTPKIKTKYYFLCGDHEGDEDMIRDLNTIEHLVHTKRCACLHLDTKKIVPNGQHNEHLWSTQFVAAFLYLTH